MGNYNITINGTGCHHNKDNPTDADFMFLEFVDKLKAAGHNVDYAAFTSGSITKPKMVSKCEELQDRIDKSLSPAAHYFREQDTPSYLNPVGGVVIPAIADLSPYN